MKPGDIVIINATGRVGRVVGREFNSATVATRKGMTHEVAKHAKDAVRVVDVNTLPPAQREEADWLLVGVPTPYPDQWWPIHERQGLPWTPPSGTVMVDVVTEVDGADVNVLMPAIFNFDMMPVFRLAGAKFGALIATPTDRFPHWHLVVDSLTAWEPTPA